MTFLILVIGDLHIPDRALDIPAKVRAEKSPSGFTLELVLSPLLTCDVAFAPLVQEAACARQDWPDSMSR